MTEPIGSRAVEFVMSESRLDGIVARSMRRIRERRETMAAVGRLWYVGWGAAALIVVVAIRANGSAQFQGVPAPDEGTSAGEFVLTRTIQDSPITVREAFVSFRPDPR